MEVKVLFNNISDSNSPSQGWGLSLLVDKRILFDTGENPDFLHQGSDHKEFFLSRLESVVISHDHWDHTGGVHYLLRKKKDLKIYICPGFGPAFKRDIFKLSKNIIKVDRFQKIAPHIYTTGELIGFYKERTIAEQALILQTEHGFSVVTGCAHPEIVKMLKHVKSQIGASEFYAVIGGFHLRDEPLKNIETIVKEFSLLGVKHVAPLHCTGTEAVKAFQEVYQNACHVLEAGQGIEV